MANGNKAIFYIIKPYPLNCMFSSANNTVVFWEVTGARARVCSVCVDLAVATGDMGKLNSEVCSFDAIVDTRVPSLQTDGVLIFMEKMLLCCYYSCNLS